MTAPHPIAVVWSQFILAATLHRLGGCYQNKGLQDAFCYVDTHAGSGKIAPPDPALAFFRDRRELFSQTAFASALDTLPAERFYPGSWVLAAQVLTGVPVEFDIDINDLSSEALEQARQNQQIGRIRYWSHDWFKFLRSRLNMARSPQFVFIDPPHAEDGAAYASEAAILLDTLKIPYMATYSVAPSDDVINMIGRSGLEFHGENTQCAGVLLGGGAERILLPILPDLRVLAECLGGRFTIRTPQYDDFTI